MTRRHRSRPAAFLPGGSMLRVGSLIVMLLIMGMTINRFRPRGAPRLQPQEVVGEAEAAPQPVVARQSVVADRPDAKIHKEPVPIVHDAAETATFTHDAEAIADRSLTILPVERKAYWQLLRWVKEEPLSALVAANPPPVNYQNFVLRPEKHRGELVQMDLLVRRALKYDAPEGNSAGVKTLYELWGWPADAHGRMYTIVTPELPAGFPIGSEIEETAHVYGYFFKLQAYELGGAKPYAAPQFSPLLVGRIQWAPFVGPNARIDSSMYIGAAVVGAILLAMIGSWVWIGMRRPAKLALRNATLPATADGDIDLDRNQDESDYEDRHGAEPEADPFRWVKEADGQDDD